jgi:RNA polymerase sigma factor (sigma-70 family)
MTIASDAGLLAAARNDPHAFRELYDRYAPRVHAFHVARCRDDDTAHDLTAETFAQAWLSRTRFEDEAGGSAGPWLFAIARHVLLNSVRRRMLEQSARERLGMLDGLDRSHAPEPDESWLEGVDAALAQLPAGQREAIELRVLGDLDYGRAAERLDTTPAAVRVRVHRGLAALRDHFTNSMEAR